MASADKELFFERMEMQELALTYDDVRMRTRSSQDLAVPADGINIESRFSENVELKLPFVSAAMDTVTTSRMAIAMAKLGGIGVIHGAMPIDDQRREVRRVKKEVNALIDDPRFAQDTDTLQSVLNRCNSNRWDFRTFPVLDSDGKFVGILSGDDFKYPESMTITVADAMTPASDVVSAPVGTTLSDAYKLMRQRKKSMLPLLEADNTVSGLYLFSDVNRVSRDLASYNTDHNGQLIAAAAVSTGPTALERVEALSKYVDVVVIDTADGDSHYAFQTLKDVKAAYPDLDIVVGNISEGSSARELTEAGANGIKVGQGPGSICTTRRETGIGMPQVTAVYECVKALGKDFAHIPVCADGGIKDHGDIPIAFAAGAHSVMMGRMLAGTEEAPGEVVVRKDSSRWKIYRGMGSADALAQNVASRERYDVAGTGLFLAEGVVSQVPFEGSVENVAAMCALALRKAMSYVKAPDLQYHRENTRLRRITNAGLRESHPHDIDVITQ